MSFIRHTLTNNLGLKITAFVFALLLWILVVNVDDPSQSKTFTTNVQFANEDVLLDQGKYYEVPENGNTISFRVTAKRSIMERLSASDFTALADFNNLENDTRIPVEISVNRYTSSVGISGNQKYIYLEIGEKMEQKFVVSGEVSGSPADGYAVGSVAVKPNVITVSGPADLVAMVDHVEAVCDVSGVDTDVSESVVPSLLNSTGDILDPTKLTLSENTVKVTVKMLTVKTVGVDLETSGELPEGVSLKSVTVEPKSIKIMGSSELINGITSVRIPGNVLDLSGVSSSVETTLDIRTYLPDGVSLASGNDPLVNVKIDIDEDGETTIDIPTANLTVQNLDPEYKVEFLSDTISVKLSGTQSLLDDIADSEIAGFVDASGLTEGEHSVTVTLNLNEGITASAATVQIDVSLKNPPGEATEEEPGQLPEESQSEDEPETISEETTDQDSSPEEGE